MRKSSKSHSFDPQIALEVGVEAAIVLNHFHYWIDHNRIAGTAQENGTTWTFQSLATMSKYLPYFSQKQLRGCIDKLVNAGYIVKGKFNKNKFDQTTWYSVPEAKPADPEDLNKEYDMPETANQCLPSGHINATEKALASIYSKDSKEELEQQQHNAVVVPSYSRSFQLLKAQGFDDKTAVSLAKFPLEQIERQIEHLKNAQDIVGIDNPLGWLRNAIEYDWKPAEPKKDSEAETAEIRKNELLERADAKQECEQLYDEYENKFTTRKYFDIGVDVITMRSGDRHFGIPYDGGAVKTLRRFIEIEFQQIT